MYIFLIVLGVGVILFFIIRKIRKVQKKEQEKTNREADREKWNDFYKEEKKRKQAELPMLTKEADEIVDKYEQRIAEGQDKYQIGRTLYEIKVKYREEFSRRLYADTPSIYRRDIENFYQRIDDVCDTDILIERGFKEEEQAQKKQQQKADREWQKQQALTRMSEKDEYITETFVGGSRASVEVLVNNYINLHKDYVLTFKAPIEKSVFGTHSTTITMKKVK